MNKEVIKPRLQQKIRKLANGELSCSQIAEQIGLSYQTVYDFILRERLTVKSLPGSKLAQSQKKSNFFNVDEMAWI